MNLYCNGELRTVSGPLTLKEFLAQLGHNRPGIAVAVNESVVPVSRWESTLLCESDQILVIQAAQGG